MQVVVDINLFLLAPYSGSIANIILEVILGQHGSGASHPVSTRTRPCFCRDSLTYSQLAG